MKAKTLLIAVAALAAGVISSSAQVYSQNIVGYANITYPSSIQNYLVAVPFKIGSSNGANEVFPSLPQFSGILIWDPNVNNFVSYTYDTGSFPTTGWTIDSVNPAAQPVLPVGMGFFLSPGSDNFTNTFAGAVAVSVGSQNTNTLASSLLNYCVGSPVPYAGSVTNGNGTTGGLNMNSLPDFTGVLIWDPSVNNFVSWAKDFADFPSTGWSFDGVNAATPPTLSVGQGVFISPGSDGGKWIMGL